jgi:hypothetical protein
VTFSGEIPKIAVKQIIHTLLEAGKSKQLMLCFDVDGTLLPYREGFESFTDKKIAKFVQLAQ